METKECLASLIIKCIYSDIRTAHRISRKSEKLGGRGCGGYYTVANFKCEGSRQEMLATVSAKYLLP